MSVNKGKAGVCDMCQDYGTLFPEILDESNPHGVNWVCGQCVGEMEKDEEEKEE